MKKLITVGLAVLLIVALAVPAFAWEFSMTGQQEWRFRHFSRLGSNDLFGKDAAGLEIGFAGPNIYGHTAAAQVTPQAVVASRGSTAGMRIVRGGFSYAGPDAFYNDSRITLVPTIKVNPAIRVYGTYNIGGYRNKYRQWNDMGLSGTAATPGAAYPGPYGVGTPPFERYYMHQTSPSATDTAAVGSWEQFRGTIHTPWCIWSYGIKDFPFGTGITNSYNVRAESMLTIVPYGPFKFLWPVWTAQNAINYGPGVNPDPDAKPTFFQGLTLIYQAGAIDCGAQILAQNVHVKNLYKNVPAVYAPRTDYTAELTTTAPYGYDQFLRNWIVYAMYNNGRFFANGEYSWVTIDKYNIGARPTFTEAYHWIIETGVYSGPAKLTFMTAAASGSVLNKDNPTKNYTSFPINYQAMEPYEWLMFNIYGGGNQTYGGLLATDDGTGQMGDAYCLAGRLDYAVAANLNVYGSYIWAHRLEQNGVAFGAYASTGGTASSTAIANFAANAGRSAVYNGTYTYGYVTNGFIGWEVNLGVDWKWLENLTMKVRYSYWQPGEYFKEAYQARVPTGSTYTDYGVLNSRDAIQGFQASLLVDF